MGTDPNRLTNREKTILVKALREEFTLEELLSALNLARSSFYYQISAIKRPDKHACVRVAVCEEFEALKHSCGYRTIWARLRKRSEPIVVSEKIVRRIMAQEGLKVIYHKKPKRQWSSYAGEISNAPKNIIKRQFFADSPNKLWLTDITQFVLPSFKCYLSPVIDCFDGKVISWKISKSPNAKLVNSMLDDAITTLRFDEHPILHNDRGAHYRWSGWISRCNNAGIIRSMSKKVVLLTILLWKDFSDVSKMSFSITEIGANQVMRSFAVDWKNISTTIMKGVLKSHLAG